MTTFGFSAYVKLLCSNPRPRRTQIRQRLFPEKDGGYDFHRKLRTICHSYLVGGVAITDAEAMISEIVRPAERKSVREGVKRLVKWRTENPGEILQFEPKVYESPAELFKVKFTANFGLHTDGKRTAIHIWNNLKPPLDRRMVFAALGLFSDAYVGDEVPADDIAVLSLQDGHLYRFGAAGVSARLGPIVAKAIDGIVQSVIDEKAPPSPGGPR